MGSPIFAIVLAAALGFVLTLGLGKLVLEELRRLHAGQSIREDGPTWHAAKAGTPTMGGVMFILGSGIVTLALSLPALAQGQFVCLYVFLFALAFGFIGLADDARKVLRRQNEGLTAMQKLVLQLAAAALFLTLMRLSGSLTNVLYVPGFGWQWEIPWPLYLFFAAFVIVGCVNAVNITDGVDGLAGSVTLVVMAFFTACGALDSLYFSRHGIFPAALMGGLAAFLRYNRHPAQVFMGDTGSLFLGGAVAALSFALDMPLILLPVGIVYIAETLSDIIQVGYFKYTKRKTGTGKRVFKMAPLHHHLELCGWSEEKLCGVASLVTAAGCVLALLAVAAR